MAIKPILFNTEMVRAILDGRKTCTRRLVRFLPGENPQWTGYIRDGLMLYNGRNEPCIMKAPYQPGDILYVRETWCKYGKLDCFDHVIEGTEKYYYAADGANPTPYNTFLVQRDGYDEYKDTPVWHPSIHMPKEAARIWLKVTDVRVERLQYITEAQAEKEGFIPQGLFAESEITLSAAHWFSKFWNFTIKKSDLDRYGWAANPWVWVIEFDRCEKPDIFAQTYEPVSGGIESPWPHITERFNRVV